MKTLTVEDYKAAGDEFWPKYWYISKELGEGAKVEDVLKVMETVCKLAHKKRAADEIAHAPFGFNKKVDDGTEEKTDSE